LLAVWESEKHLVYAKVCAEANPTSAHLSNLQWKVCTQLASKPSSKPTMTAKLDITTLQLSKQQHSQISFSMPPKQLLMMKEKLKEASQFLDKNLLGS
jgi:hypothetical protein